jgi:hypothetical protein
MAYVVARPKGRFEIRESLHTRDGPRARSLAGFAVLTDAVLAKAARRAQRPFDMEEVLASGRRAGAPLAAITGATSAITGAGRATDDSTDDSTSRFVEASRRMARTLRRPPVLRPADPGAALIDLLGFADAVTASQPARPFAPLEFPALSRLAEDRHGSARSHGSAPRTARRAPRGSARSN